ncbi:DOMON-like domain-containing protein [Aromatoleum diolicum]|uniref:DOMON-like domain-containing protein n=1 Tax=Aromatoleum diolicum TaxID=75796 RepID=A0ABX1QCW7_9RHOO|nr:DOMON-like domain-containing protein [Aromatoleum diolicum]NMG75365.1 hypothetical protein [Aromatoleum diolicum]
MNAATPITLQAHPQTTTSPTRTIAVDLQWGADGTLRLRFELRGRLERIVVPPQQAPLATDGLWAHTCCEAFVAVQGSATYREFNFSPSRQWAIYDFSAYRTPAAAPAPLPAPTITLRRDGELLTLEAAIEAAALPPGEALQLGLSAVVEADDGTLSYWALHHPGARPDFHHRDAFTLTLSPPRP